MSAASATAERAGTTISPRLIACIGIAVGVLGMLVTVPPLLLETPIVPAALGAIAIAIGAVAIARGERFLGVYAVAAGGLGILAGVLVQSAEADTVQKVVAAGLFTGMLTYATPLVFAALGGLVSERSGVTNIGLEGMMLSGCFWGIFFCDKADSWVIGILGAMAAGGLMGLVHAFFSIHLQADQIVSGTAINILALGVTAYAFQTLYDENGTPEVPIIPDVTIPLLEDVPYLGEVLGTMNLMVWVSLILAVVIWVFLFKTPWGLRLRAVGEHPRAADTVGVRVYRVRYLAVTASGMLAAAGGAYLSFGLLSSFNENMTAGRGFIALAALIFGRWHPFGLLGAALLFGFTQSLGDQLQTSAGISAYIVTMLPYVAVLVALVGLVGRSIPPAAVGLPYKRQ